MFKRVKAIFIKEVYHILRDPRSLTIVFLMPILMVLIYGYALNMDIKNIPVGVIDCDRSTESKTLVRSFEASEYFNVTTNTHTRENAEQSISSGDVKAVVIIPQNFEKNKRGGFKSHIQLLVDGSDPTFGNAAVNYTEALLAIHILKNQVSLTIAPIDIRDRFLYNPNLKGAHFIIPGLVAVILMMVCALLTSITISREKETGTMDILFVSPVHPYEIVIGKVSPYIFISILDAVFILVFSKLIFDIPVKGDLMLLLLLSTLFIYCALSIGIFISSIAPTQQVAMMAALVATILPSIILSGFIFPIFSMPKPIQYLTVIVPAKYYMNIIRGILLKSCTFDVLHNEAGMLILIGTIFLIIATTRFQMRKRS